MIGSGINHLNPEIMDRAREAERLLRDCLAIRLREPDAAHWRTTGDVPSRLGGALVAVAVTDANLSVEARIAKLAEAETLLLEGNEALQKGEKVDNKYKRDSLTRLVRLYDALEEPEKVVEWRKKLDEFDETDAGQKAEEEDKPETGEKDDSPRH